MFTLTEEILNGKLHFLWSDCNLRLLPLSKSVLLEHIKQAALWNSWLWKGEKNVMQQDPVLQGWVRREDRLIPNWQLNEPSITINDTLRHVYVLVNAKVVSVVKVTWNVFCFVVAKINAKTNELYNYSRYVTHLFNKSYLILLCLQVFLCFQIFLIYFVKKKERKTSIF